MKCLLSLLFILSFLSACGKPQEGRLSPKLQELTPEMLTALIGSQTLYCSDKTFCPEGLARMFSVNFEDNAQSIMCSAFLVSEDTVLTNSHCVWVGKIGLEQTCGGLYFSFLSDSGVSYPAGCSKILWRDRLTSGRKNYKKGFNDFALVKLDRKIPLTPLKLRRGGLTPGTRVYPVVTDHQNPILARMTKLDCQVTSVNKYGIADLENCPIISGNSGSAVFDKDKNVVGLIFASSDNDGKKPQDEVNLRQSSQETGYAFSIDMIATVLEPFIKSGELPSPF